MLLPIRIDLTENGDFSGGSLTADVNGMDTEIPDEVHDGNMTLEQYDRLCRWEELFGKRRHENGKRRIFPKVLYSYRTYCYDCGKELRLPWARAYRGLCKECFDKSPYVKNIPWKMEVVNRDSKGYRLFNSR